MSRHKNIEDKKLIPSRQEIEEWLYANTPLKCYYSGESLDILKITIDHKIPINRGGKSVLSNLCVSSHSMNTAKGIMTDFEFFQLLNLILGWEDKGKNLLKRLKQAFY